MLTMDDEYIFSLTTSCLLVNRNIGIKYVVMDLEMAVEINVSGNKNVHVI